MLTLINVINSINNNAYNSLKALFLSFLLAFSFTSQTDEYVPIPLDKLVCYGQGTQQQLSPSGEFLAAMVPVDAVSYTHLTLPTSPKV